MELPSIDSLIFVLLIILPGFIVIKLSDRIIGRSPFTDNFEITIWSGFISVILYVLTTKLYNYIFNGLYLGRYLLIWLISIIIIVAIRICLIKWDILDNIRTILFKNDKIKYQPHNSIWDAIIPGYSEYVIVYTSDGLKYGGNILLFSKGIGKTGKDNKEIFLENPIILNDTKLEEYEKNLKGVLLLVYQFQINITMTQFFQAFHPSCIST